ncbi:hypothetical protein GN958_ATG15177, partial [Phytophthora infestans]
VAPAPQKIWHQAALHQEGTLCGTLLATTAPRRVCCAGQPARGSNRAMQGKLRKLRGASWCMRCYLVPGRMGGDQHDAKARINRNG